MRHLMLIPPLSLAYAALGAPVGGAPFIVIAFGDSTTAPRGDLVVYPMLLEQALATGERPVRVINAGIPANATTEARARFKTDVLNQQPNLVIMQFGINDAVIDVWRGESRPRVLLTDYTANLNIMLAALQAQGIQTILMTPNPLRWTDELRALYGKPPYDLTDPEGLNGLLPRYVQQAREVAARFAVPLVDSFAAFQEYGQKTGQTVDDLLLDGMHPNTLGHALEAELLLPHVWAVMEHGGTDS